MVFGLKSWNTEVYLLRIDECQRQSLMLLNTMSGLVTLKRRPYFKDKGRPAAIPLPDSFRSVICSCIEFQQGILGYDHAGLRRIPGSI
ncbi:MAG: hypothetical protein MZU84_07555 [Sphingobacterium sp.]|nr:hypothetical protein [Sphingobacterium sp.]